MPPSVLIVQHGEKQAVPGDPGLTPVGRTQATRVADHLSGAGISIPRIYSSPLRRATETAEAIGERLHRPVIVDDRLRERMNWELDGYRTIDAFLRDWAAATADRDFQPLHGDSSRVAAARFVEFLDHVGQTTAGGVVVVVSHGGITTDLLRDLLGDQELVRRAPDVIPKGIPCGAITRLSPNVHGWQPDDIASNVHLTTAPPVGSADPAHLGPAAMKDAQ
jgi:broad specificity phosphatase PhoE